jgi:hypothetical protein
LVFGMNWSLFVFNEKFRGKSNFSLAGERWISWREIILWKNIIYSQIFWSVRKKTLDINWIEMFPLKVDLAKFFTMFYNFDMNAVEASMDSGRLYGYLLDFTFPIEMISMITDLIDKSILELSKIFGRFSSTRILEVLDRVSIE